MSVEPTVHGYLTALWWSAVLLLAGFLLCGALLTGQVPSAGADAGQSVGPTGGVDADLSVAA